MLQAQAGVVIGGTRFVYPEREKSISFSVRNPSDESYLIYTKVEPGGLWTGADAPHGVQSAFVATPQLFSLRPQRENTIRLIFTGGKLPENRETLFTLNVAAIPSANPHTTGVQTAALRWSRNKNNVVVNNPTPYYITLYQLSLGASERSRVVQTQGYARHWHPSPVSLFYGIISMEVSTSLRRLSLLLAATLTFSAAAQEEQATPQQIEQTGKAAEAYFAAHPEKMGEIVSTYLAEHPEFLVAAGESLRQRQEIAQQQAMVQNVILHREQLLAGGDPVVGPANAKVAVVSFVDEQCVNCNVTETLIHANPDIRFIFKKLPSAGSANKVLQDNVKLVKQIGFANAPAFVVLPQEKDPVIQRISVMSGNVSSDALIMAIQKAKG
ncbi:hypothetical protein ID866_1566 [Astraeus odoratus]|nr:hypothetical protein ID866_1566 [Astraeus odoratus]